MKNLLAGLFVALLATTAAAQNVRDAVPVGFPTGDAIGTALASDADLSAAFYVDSNGNKLNMITADGRGLPGTWTFPVQVDQANTGLPKTLFQDGAAVAGDHIYVTWLDHRQPVNPAGPRDVCFNSSYNGGLTWTYGPDLILHKGLVPFGNDIIDVCMRVDARHEFDPFDDLIAVAILVENDVTKTGEVFLNYSLDSGQTFLPTALRVSASPGPPHATAIGLDIELERIYVVWQDAFASPGVWMSAFNAYLGTFMFQDELVNVDTFGFFKPEGELAIDARELVPGEQTIAVLWQQREFLRLNHQLFSNVFIWNGALTKMGDQLVGNYGITHDVDHPGIAVSGIGYIAAVWQDNRMGVDRVFTALTKNKGMTWMTDKVLSDRAAGFPQILSPRQTMVVTWVNLLPPVTLESALSLTSGEFWKQPVTISNAGLPVMKPVMALNPLYTNFIMAWQGFDGLNDNVFVGGFRPQTLKAIGDFGVPFTPVYFELSNWCRKDHNLPFAIVASGIYTPVGGIPVPDGRLLGLVNDAIFSQTFPFKPILMGTIDPNGNGVTPTFPSPGVPFTLYAVAGTLPVGGYGSLTDVLVIN